MSYKGKQNMSDLSIIQYLNYLNVYPLTVHFFDVV